VLAPVSSKPSENELTELKLVPSEHEVDHDISSEIDKRQEKKIKELIEIKELNEMVMQVSEMFQEMQEVVTVLR
jgi:hypothetical protein